MEKNILYLAIPFSLLACLIANLGYVLEKKAASSLKKIEETSFRKNIKNFATSRLWMLGFTFTILTLPFSTLALTFGSITLNNIVGSVGIFALLIFSNYLLKEKISREEIVILIIISLGLLIASIASINTQTQTDFADYWQTFLSVESLAIIFSSILFSLVLTTFSALNSYSFADIAFSTFAGISASLGIILLKGFGTMFRSFSTSFFTDWRFYLVLILFTLVNLGATFSLQFAFQKGRAVITIPIYNGLIFVLPIIYGLFALNEWVLLIIKQRIFLLFGVVLILIGSSILSLSNRKEFE
ncbi:MAG: DMT family transporter [Candidatus Heimdallarchaeaceae archaeon]